MQSNLIKQKGEITIVLRPSKIFVNTVKLFLL